MNKKQKLISLVLVAAGLLCSSSLFSPALKSPETTTTIISGSGNHAKNTKSSQQNDIETEYNRSTNQSVQTEAEPLNTNKATEQVLTKQTTTLPGEVPYYLLATVNDPLFGGNWAHTSLQTNRAWDLSTGSSGVTVAVIDTGYQLEHADLIEKWATNSGETGQTTEDDPCWTGSPADKSNNGCDDDENGYVDDWRGYDFYNDDNSVQAGETNPSGEGTRHGTMVAGTIAATANNNIGGSGVDMAAKILPLQVFSDDAEAYTSTIVAAVNYATSLQVDVINLSLGSTQYDPQLLSAITAARSAGVLVIAASGNCALNDEIFCNYLTGPGRMTYPALYDNVIAVGSIDSNSTRSDFSSYGPKLDIVAPGGMIGPLPTYSSSSSTSHAYASGTSFSAPYVAAVASLLIAQNPTASITEIEFLLTESTIKSAVMSGNSFANELGYGLANAHRATLLGLARTENQRLGENSLSPRQPSVGYIWRAASGSVSSDESILIGCRVSSGDICNGTLTRNGTTHRFNSASNAKGSELQYIFARGSDLTNGTWSAAIHNRHSATSIGTITR